MLGQPFGFLMVTGSFTHFRNPEQSVCITCVCGLLEQIFRSFWLIGLHPQLGEPMHRSNAAGVDSLLPELVCPVDPVPGKGGPGKVVQGFRIGELVARGLPERRRRAERFALLASVLLQVVG
ncbi:hypothetical protein AQJ91_05945 [Streptomyces dysideae]|uniref:Uncharacterized protein n=1 Tax=Streptomyces dysideae TaxID=909626 RepID=A0A101V417_9ACTN|nr:hypothetical protein AQJ91_05945 [Streptomyces dysideae]